MYEVRHAIVTGTSRSSMAAASSTVIFAISQQSGVVHTSRPLFDAATPGAETALPSKLYTEPISALLTPQPVSAVLPACPRHD